MNNFIYINFNEEQRTGSSYITLWVELNSTSMMLQGVSHTLMGVNEPPIGITRLLWMAQFQLVNETVEVKTYDDFIKILDFVKKFAIAERKEISFHTYHSLRNKENDVEEDWYLEMVREYYRV